MTDAVVDALEVVDVEDDEREVPLVALSTQDLAPERLVEVALVVEAGERVRLRELSGFAVAAGVLDRRDTALRERFCALDELCARLVVGRAPEKRECPDGGEVSAHQ